MCVWSQRVPVSGALGPKLGTCASPSKVDEIDTTGQLIKDGVIGSSEEESKGA